MLRVVERNRGLLGPIWTRLWRSHTLYRWAAVDPTPTDGPAEAAAFHGAVATAVCSVRWKSEVRQGETLRRAPHIRRSEKSGQNASRQDSVTAPVVLVNLGELPFSPQRRRNQVIFEHLVGERSLFIDGLYVNPARVSWPKVPSMADLRDFVRPVEETPEGRFRGRNPTFVLPSAGGRRVAQAQVAFLANRLRAYLRGRPYCLWVNNPEYHPCLLADALRPGANSMVVDLSDDFTAFSDRDPIGLERRVRRLVADSDVLITVNEHVARKYPHATSLVFPNATDFEALQRCDPRYSLGDVLPKPDDRKIVGFIGGLHTGRVDEPLLMELISRLNDVFFVFSATRTILHC